MPGQVNYSAAKAAVTGMTRRSPRSGAATTVTVNCVAFGYMQTRLTKPLAEGEAGTIEVAGPQGEGRRAGRAHRRHEPDHPARPRRAPEEAAGAIYLFCSPDSDFVSGQTLVVTGGA